MELRMYSTCAYLSSDFLGMVEKAFFFDHGGGALFLTTGGHLFAVGRMFNSYLGVGRHFVPKALLRVKFPRDAKIQDFATRGTRCIGLTREGSVFHWGGSVTTPKLVYCLRDHCVIQISSGENFFMAVCTNGQVWAWKGRHFACYKISPKDEDMIDTDCSLNVMNLAGIFRPLVLLNGGKIYFPKLPFSDMIPSFVYLTKPVKSLLAKEKIVKLVCGKFRAFALSSGGALYTWNEYRCQDVITPENIASDLGRLIDIRTPLDIDEVLIQSINGKIFRVFRKYGTGKLWASQEVKCSHFNEYEATNNLSSYGWRECVDIPVETSEESQISGVKWLRKWMNSFNNPEDSDITFIVEGKMIYAHQMHLSLQCNNLKAILNKQHKDSLNRIIMPIERVSHSTFYRFIKFLYCGQLDIGSSQGNIELLKLVHEYDYDPLMNLCEEVVIRGIREDNVCMLYSLASRLGLKNLKKESHSFVRGHQEDMEKHGYSLDVTAVMESE